MARRGLRESRGCPVAARGHVESAVAAVPPVFERDAVGVARRGHLSQVEVVADFDVSTESVRGWVRQTDVDDGFVDGQTSGEHGESGQLRREKRRLEVKNEIVRGSVRWSASVPDR